MKFLLGFGIGCIVGVTPLVGVWIEICSFKDKVVQHCVTPLVGVWIEITGKLASIIRRRVTPLVGVWIEIKQRFSMSEEEESHSPCGSVD